MYSVRVFVISMETSNLHTIRSDCCVKKPGIPVTEQYILEHYLYCQEVKTEMFFWFICHGVRMVLSNT